MDETPKYRMRFVGFDRHGELKRGAPGVFKRNEVRELTIEYASDPWWELVDAIPDLVIPEEKYEDSVFVAETFVPPEDAEKMILPVTADMDNLDVIDYEGMTIASLKPFIEGRGGEWEKEWLKPDFVTKARELEEARRAREIEANENEAEESLKAPSESS